MAPVRISKPGVTWPPPDFLDSAMQEFERMILQKYPARILSTDVDFCEAVGHIQGEFLAIHPFREGDADDQAGHESLGGSNQAAPSGVRRT